MRIGELCQRAGVSRDTVRFYERRGLLPQTVQRELTSGYRCYELGDLRRLQRIRYAKGLGFSLAEIETLLDVWMDGTVTNAQRRKGLRSKLQQVHEQQKALESIRLAIVAQIEQL